MHVVWFKRDLRWQDHLPLWKAAQQGPVLPLYIVEPKFWQQPDASHRHYSFLCECLQDLNAHLTGLGQPLVIRVGEALTVLQALHAQHGIEAVWSHQETGNAFTYARDRAIKTWLRDVQIPWHEPAQHGIVRGLKNRDGWAQQWAHHMRQATVSTLQALVKLDVATQSLPTPKALGLMPDGCVGRQRGGRMAGLALLASFLNERGQGYTRDMSSPVTAFEACSRLSAHIAYGTLSMREIFHAVQVKQHALRGADATEKGTWPSAMRSFSGRLRWHCHFMQKLEDQPSIEFENLHPAYDALRTEPFNAVFFDAWCMGKTGFPMIDACMRALRATGWLNFRMRAMVMSFASYHLWLHWRQPALYLATMFVDYEPGIHYSQVQMQSGTTGINAVRIYNPIKQSVDQDPSGVFLRRWLPELSEMPDAMLHTPWDMPHLMQDYPMPIVDEKTARKQAADRIYGLRGHSTHRAQAKAIVQKHGSRRRAPKKQKVRRPPSPPEQGVLF